MDSDKKDGGMPTETRGADGMMEIEYVFIF
jgi:hypothetical protein